MSIEIRGTVCEISVMEGDEVGSENLYVTVRVPFAQAPQFHLSQPVTITIPEES